MIRFITCFRRRPGLTPEAFRARWEDPAFERLVGRMAEATGALGFARNATLVVGANAFVQEQRGLEEPFDGVLEYFLDNAAHFQELLTDSGFQALQREMQACQEQFADLGSSVAFFTEARQAQIP